MCLCYAVHDFIFPIIFIIRDCLNLPMGPVSNTNQTWICVVFHHHEDVRCAMCGMAWVELSWTVREQEFILQLSAVKRCIGVKQMFNRCVPIFYYPQLNINVIINLNTSLFYMHTFSKCTFYYCIETANVYPIILCRRRVSWASLSEIAAFKCISISQVVKFRIKIFFSTK